MSASRIGSWITLRNVCCEGGAQPDQEIHLFLCSIGILFSKAITRAVMCNSNKGSRKSSTPLLSLIPSTAIAVARIESDTSALNGGWQNKTSNLYTPRSQIDVA